jgi:two-component system sensor histidine kinase AlgZ
VHPLFARASRFLLYLAAWLVGGVLLAIPLVAITPRPFVDVLAFAVPLAILYGGICLGAWWVCLSRPLTGENPMPAILSQLAAAGLSATLWAIAATAWGLALASMKSMPPDRAVLLSDVMLLFGISVPLYLLSAVAHYLLLALEDSHAAAQRALALQVTAREAELRAVRSQLNPHFLFNSLNSINALVGTDPEGARRMCEGLGDFLRRTLQLGARETVTLADELALVDRYLAIEQVRFGQRLTVEQDVDAAACACRLPPLLLQPLVENAIKHGVADRIEGGRVRLSARRESGRLVIILENPFDADARMRAGEGMGLEIVRRRLEALGDARLSTAREDGRFRVTLSLPALEEREVFHA